MESLGVIEKGRGVQRTVRGECAGMVVAPKTNGDVRMCADLTKLNKNVKKENFPMPRVEKFFPH